MRPFLFLIAFGAAIWAIGEGWAALRILWTRPTGPGAAAALGYLAVFVIAFLYVGFGIYAAERAAGKVRTPIGLYERILARRQVHNGDRGAGNGERPAGSGEGERSAMMSGGR